MGTSNTSSYIYNVFESIGHQLELVYKIQDEEYKKLKIFKDKLEYISEKYLSSENKEKLIIFLDSIDQLSSEDLNLKWMFNKLPKNVKIIYSVLSNYGNILNNLKGKLYKENVIEIKPLRNDEAKNILSTCLKEVNRRLTNKQYVLINEMIDKFIEISPLQIKLIFEVVSQWKSSFEVPAEFIRCKTSKEIIKYLFDRIQKEIFDNEILFKGLLFYLNLFEFKGISENELEDILSIDDQVLNSIFVHHHPPVRRFPIALWYRFKFEFKDYLTHKMTDNLPVVAW